MSACNRSFGIVLLYWDISWSTNRQTTDGNSSISSFLTFLTNTKQKSDFEIKILVSVTLSMKRKTAFKATSETYDGLVIDPSVMYRYRKV